MPGKPVLVIPGPELQKLSEILENTPEFPFHGDLQHPFSSEPLEEVRAAEVQHIVSLCKRFKRAFESQFEPLAYSITTLFEQDDKQEKVLVNKKLLEHLTGF